METASTIKEKTLHGAPKIMHMELCCQGLHSYPIRWPYQAWPFASEIPSSANDKKGFRIVISTNESSKHKTLEKGVTA